MSHIESFLSFLQACPTSWHCVKEVESTLSSHSFQALQEKELWEMEKGGKYFVSRGGSIASFCLPKKAPSQIRILAAHTDSPSLKLKPNPLLADNSMARLEVEVYGSPILHSWLNRDLALAGRVFFKNKKGEIEEKLLFLDEAPLIIPELAIHLQRDVNEKGPPLNKQEHLMPIFPLMGHENSLPSLETLLRKHCDYPSLLSFDLFLVPLEAPRLLGPHQDWIASYRLDNLVSVHAAMTAMINYTPSSTLPLSIFWDHEEVGSKSWEGADSSFLADVLTRVRHFYKMTDEEFLVLKRNSLCLSLDMAHGLNPLHAHKHDPNHQPILGKGIVLKHNANLRYASTAQTLAQALLIGKKAKLPLQYFVNRSDMPCGSTVGPFITASSGIPTVDLGCAQLSMHSAREIIAKDDYLDCITFLKEALKKP
jgi:aspartyl aminopeptidase